MLLSSTIGLLAVCVACSLFQVYHASIVTVGAPLPLLNNQANMQTMKTRSVFLLNGDLPDGIFYGIRAIFLDDVTRVTFQVWRPAVNQTGYYQLVALYPPFKSQGVLSSEQSVYLNNFLLWDGNATNDLQLSCFNVMGGDKIGMYFESATTPNLGTIPYVFSTGGLVQAYIDLALSPTDYEKQFTTNETVKFESGVFPRQFQITAVIETDPSAQCNTLVMPGDQMVTQVQMTTPFLRGPPGPPGATGATGPEGLIGSMGSTGDQGPPGSIGATGVQGPPGPVGSLGSVGATGFGPTGDQGPVGPPGATGYTGYAGPPGAVGIEGPPGPDGQGSPQTVASTGTLNNDNFVTGLIIWLAILSFIVIVILISIIALFCCYCGRQRQRKRERDEAAKAPFINSRDGGVANPGYSNNAYNVPMTDDAIPAKRGGRPLSTFSQGPSSSGYQQPYYNGGGAVDSEQAPDYESIGRDPSYKGSRPIGLSRPLAPEDATY